jgi:uncharacterized membrane protein YfcA
MSGSLAFIFIAGLGAGFVDAIAGGSGLIMVPAMIFVGLGGSLTGAIRFPPKGGRLVNLEVECGALIGGRRLVLNRESA